jgi:hypothetical protein
MDYNEVLGTRIPSGNHRDNIDISPATTHSEYNPRGHGAYNSAQSLN